MPGLLERLKARLGRTRSSLSDGLSAIFRGGRAMDGELLAELEALLYGADLGSVAGEVTANLARLHGRGELKGDDAVRTALQGMLLEKLEQPPGELSLPASPSVILVVGVNGSGKTTTVAKLAHRFQQAGKRVLLGAADTFRAAAADQLEIWAERNGAEIVRSRQDGADPAAVAFDAVQAGLARGTDVILIDTAGRLHTQKNLMEELAKIRRVLGKALPGAPHETWLVLDGTNGQNAIQQARLFTDTVDVSGLIIAKMDGTARGGALFTIREALNLPVRYIGTGESLELLEAFDPEAFVAAILDR
ncbi:MAG: signal recognition particle-docking protein FtsY [Planctomycetota bacterium]|jgi:fused signal recognition particle receptor|nr:signal recognition particle-docking protein FtsY [Planctomycetota bacterium]MDP6839461.1 signal recognition particle-docking protein FtsY [Planctomycetota bacterium]MDP6954636.1 signal recognition particle-docking protein FtsY [Planctomycetota bacterium]